MKGQELSATVCVAAGALVVCANLAGWNLPLLQSDRASTAALALLAAALFAFASAVPRRFYALRSAIDMLSIAATVLALAGLLVGGHLVMGALLVTLALTWLACSIAALRQAHGSA